MDDRGRLVITNERLIFLGGNNTFSWPLTKILSIEPFADGVRVNAENKKPVVFRTGSRLAAIVIDRARSQTLTTDIQRADNSPPES